MDKPSVRHRLETFLEDLKKLLECPVCLEVLKWPFKLCFNGHSLCTGCIKDLKACPTCQASFALEDAVVPIIVKELLESIPQFCCYRDAGCEEIVNQNPHHADSCGFRPINCPHQKCNATIPLCALLNHYKEVHPKAYIIECSEKLLRWKNVNPEEPRAIFYPIFLNENWFWLEVNNDIYRKCIRLQFFSTPIGELNSDYFVRVQFVREQFCYVYTLKAYKSGVHPDKQREDDLEANNILTDSDEEINKNNEREEDLDADNSSTVSEEELDKIDQMEIPHTSLKYLLDSEQCLKFSLKFFNISKTVS